MLYGIEELLYYDAEIYKNNSDQRYLTILSLGENGVINEGNNVENINFDTGDTYFIIFPMQYKVEPQMLILNHTKIDIDVELFLSVDGDVSLEKISDHKIKVKDYIK